MNKKKEMLAATNFDGSNGGTCYTFNRITSYGTKEWYSYELNVCTSHFGVSTNVKIPLPSRQIVAQMILCLNKVLKEMDNKYSESSINNLGELTLDTLITSQEVTEI